MKSAVLKVNGLGKCYKLFDSPRERLKSLLGMQAHSKLHWALRGVSFELNRGQCLGVIGDNGAGKSTLLKLLAGTLQASHGELQRVGRVTAILELGAGFHPDFTGRENLEFGGSLIGIGRAELLELSNEIIDFSELGEAIDRPVKTYSSGMVVRLAFALVTAVQPEVLIIDEALAVGDQHFQKKCVQRIEDFRQNGCTILFCSHSLYHVKQLCDHALWLDQGQMRSLGTTEVVLAAYEAHVRAQSSTSTLVPQEYEDKNSSVVVDVNVVAATAQTLRSSAAISAIYVENLRDGTPKQLVGPDLTVVMTVKMLGDACPSIGVMIEQVNGVGITSVGTHADGVTPVALGNGLWQARVTFTSLPLHTGEYSISGYLFDTTGLVVYDEWHDYVRFLHVFAQSTPGVVRLPHQWS